MSPILPHDASHPEIGLEVRDYEGIYADTDKQYHECDEDARVWRVYNDEAELFDAEMIAESGSSLDILLIFVSFRPSTSTSRLIHTPRPVSSQQLSLPSQ